MELLSFSMTTGAFGKDANGDAITGLGYDFSEISYSISVVGDNSFGLSFDGDEGENPWLSVGVDVSGTFDFNVGLRGEVWVDLGQIDTTLDLNTVGFVEEHITRSVVLDTSGFTVETLDVAAVGFDLSKSYISLGLGATLDAHMSASGHLTYDFGILGEDSFNFTLLDNQDITADFTYWMIPETPKVTFDLVGGLDGNITKFELGDYVEISIDVPEFEFEDPEYTKNSESGIDTVHLTGTSSPFASIEIGLASFILPVGVGPISIELDPLGEMFGEDFEDYVSLGLTGGLFDAKLVGSIAIGQELTTTSEVSAEMVTSLGETVTGNLGHDFIFATPEGEGEFIVSASYTLSQTVEASTSIVLNATLDWRALFLQLEASLDLGSLYKDTIEVAWALAEESIDLGELLGLTYSFELYNDITTYLSDAGEEEYTIRYENFVTSASGRALNLTTNQDSVIGGFSDDTITGNARDNRLLGLAGNDSILGGEGTDILNGGRGADVLDGSAGFDLVSYGRSKAGVTVNLSTGQGAGGDAEGDIISSVQGVRGSNFGDSLMGDGQENRLAGIGGNDSLYGNGGKDAFLGGAGEDRIDGGEGIDRIAFAALTAGVTVDLSAGTGHGGDAAGDVYISIENVTGTDNADNITGDGGSNLLYGLEGDDTIYGGDGNDIVRGGKGVDELFGGADIDTLDFRDSMASVAFNFRDGFAFSGGTFDSSFNGFENFIGSGYGDSGNGNAAANRLDGADGNDTMSGGSGDDTMIGGAGDDLLDGEDDNDTFVFGLGKDVVLGGDGTDTILFTGNMSSYTFSLNQISYSVDARDFFGNSISFSEETMEFLQFADQKIDVENYYF